MTSNDQAPATFSVLAGAPVRTGTQLIRLGGSGDAGTGIVPAADGILFLAGYGRVTGTDFIDFAAIRIDAQGALDVGFDGDGKVILPVAAGSDDLAQAVVLQADGKALLAGYSYNFSTGGNDFSIVRLKADGSLDAGFGTAGKALIQVGAGTDDFGKCLSVLANGKILLAGDSYNPATGTRDLGVVRLNADGTLDTGFGVGGKVLLASAGTWETGEAMAVQSDGRILLAGTQRNGSSYDLCVTRLNADGTLDTTFGSAGFRVVDVGAGTGDSGGGVAVQADGRILVAGSTYDSVAKVYAISVVRLDVDGNLDPTFGAGGKAVLPIGTGAVNVSSMVLQPDGDILVGGSGYGVGTGGSDFLVVRLDATGRPDSDFGVGGKAFVGVAGSTDQGQALALQPDGKIVVVGSSSSDGDGGVRVARLNADGSLDLGFGALSEGTALSGTAASERIRGTGSGDTILGLSGDDALVGGGGNDTLDGGGGTDTAVFEGALADYVVQRTGAILTVADGQAGRDGVDTLSGIERLQFSDFVVNLSIQSLAASLPAASLQRLEELYVAFFNRVPGADGLAYWIGQFQAGRTISQIADSFYQAGVQFSSLTGFSASMSNADFVNVVYRNVLGRPEGAAPSGLAYWTSALASGTETRGSLVSTILDSAHSFKGDAQYGWVADLLDNKILLATRIAVDWGLNYRTPEDAIANGMAAAAAVTPTGIDAALSLVGIPQGQLDLTA